MTNTIFETERLLLKPFSMLSKEEKQIVGDSWANPFNARYNAMRDPYGSVEELCKLSQPTFKNLTEYYDYMYFRVAFSKETSEIIGTCRFGQYHKCTDNSTWDFGFNVLLKHWFKGYGVEILSCIGDIAKACGVKTIRGGADMENFGSYKAMVKNGYEYVGYDEDGDYEYLLDLSKPTKSKAEIEQIWQAHLERTKQDLGAIKFINLQFINSQIVEMVKRIQSGEDENALVEKYLNHLNAIEEFKMT
ncbi:MAG: GNAT family N-acetyltransferase [Clostridia bacterium]|nr:GNAT family N-acetyltransferase [Clostridia bacterium]